MTDSDELIYSPLQQIYEAGGYRVDVRIYRLPHTDWALEVVDPYDNSNVWEEEFATDQAEFDEFLRTVREEGIETLIGAPSTHQRGAEPDETALIGPERLGAFDGFQVTGDLVAAAADAAVVLHCLPAHRGEEIAADVLDGPASVVWDQAENKMHMAKALLEALIADRTL